MGSFGDFAKKDKKKKKQDGKKGQQTSFGSSAPIFVMPRMIEKKNKKAA
jgi:hypothetical protein